MGKLVIFEVVEDVRAMIYPPVPEEPRQSVDEQMESKVTLKPIIEIAHRIGSLFQLSITFIFINLVEILLKLQQI